MIDGPFRSFLTAKCDRLIAIYKFYGLTPNGVTTLGLIFGLISAATIPTGWGVLAVAIWWLGRLFDGTDGIYARATNQSSAFGAYLDIVADMFAYSAMLLGFYFLHPNLGVQWLSVSILYTLCITSALAMGNIEKELPASLDDNRGLRLGTGLAEAGETGIAYTLFLLFPGVIHILVPIWIGILVITIVARTILLRQIAQQSQSI